MPRHSSNKGHYKQRQHLINARKCLKKLQNVPDNVNNANYILENDFVSKRQQSIDNLMEYACELDDQLLSIILVLVTKLKTCQSMKECHLKLRSTLLTMVFDLCESELEPALALLHSMRYTKGTKIGQLYSIYLQTKARDFIEKNLYQSKVDLDIAQKSIQSLERKVKTLKNKNKSLNGKISKTRQIKKQYISRIRTKARKIPVISNKQLKLAIKKRLLATKSTYNIETIQMATQLCQIGQMSYRSVTECSKKVIEWLIGEEPDKWFSTSTLVGWHKDVAAIHVNQNCLEATKSKFSAYGIMADESTRGDQKIFIICFMFWNYIANSPNIVLLELEDLKECNGQSVAHSVTNACKKYNIDPQLCLTWMTDNTAYMSGKQGGAVVLFNQKNQASSFRISCGLHSVHIMMIHFENAVFGKPTVETGFSNQKHPFNLLYLVWQLHEGYNESNKDNPMNMKSKYIANLYYELLGIRFTKFQKPLRTRWLYELQAARQFIERRESIQTFTNWFLTKLYMRKNTPKSYITKWELLKDWLEDSILQIQIECLVKFGERIYEPIMNFLVASDLQPRILHDNGELKQLPAGRRAHEMPDKVLQWTRSLHTIIDDVYAFFGNELLAATNILEDEEFELLVNDLINGIEKALSSFQTWMENWMHLPLSLCRLGSNNGSDYALSYIKVIFKKDWIRVPSLKAICYAIQLQEDIDNNPEFNDFGLSLALEDSKFHDEFFHFAKSLKRQVYEYPSLYEFVKSRIWYIVVHQQQIEGLFNKYDLKCHTNMSDDTKLAKLRLATSNVNSTVLTLEELTKQRKNRYKGEQHNIAEKSVSFGEKNASVLFDELFGRRK